MRLLHPHARALAITVAALAVSAAAHSTPLITSAAAAQALYAQWFAPQATQASQSAQQLQQQVLQYCAGKLPLTAVQQQFKQASQDWERLSAVAMGPQIERRTARMIDFQPMRLPLLVSALRKAPPNLAAMEKIGAPAKGFPVAEHLLWRQVAAPQSAPCHYLGLVAGDVAQTLEALAQATHTTAQSTELDFASNEEFINQWIGGVERLRWQAMDKPLRSAKPGKPAAVPRAASQGTLASWQAQWSGLRSLAVGTPEQPGMVNIAALVQARGWERLAQELRAAVTHADQAMSQIASADLEAVAPTVKALGQLKHLVENDIALALDITIGFSDADGD